MIAASRIIFHLLVAFEGCAGLGLKRAFFHRQKEQYLPHSVITTKFAKSELECSVHCTRLEACLSVNYKVSGMGQGLCELNNDTVSQKRGVDDVNFVYLGIAIWSRHKTESPQEIIVSKPSCKELLDDKSTLQNGIYYLQADASSPKYAVFCHMTEVSICSGGGWTLVMKMNGDAQEEKSTFTYHSPLWTNKKSFAVEDGLEGLTEKETKLASYWNTPFKKMCLGMTINGFTRWMMLDYDASSLYSAIADGQPRSTHAGRPAWRDLVPGSSLQPHCNQEGFNIAYQKFKVRIGLYANNQDRCGNADSTIGFGITYEACDIKSNITCGNLAQCSNNDNGPKLTAAFGYILVQ